MRHRSRLQRRFLFVLKLARELDADIRGGPCEEEIQRAEEERDVAEIAWRRLAVLAHRIERDFPEVAPYSRSCDEHHATGDQAFTQRLVPCRFQNVADRQREDEAARHVEQAQFRVTKRATHADAGQELLGREGEPDDGLQNVELAGLAGNQGLRAGTTFSYMRLAMVRRFAPSVPLSGVKVERLVLPV